MARVLRASVPIVLALLVGLALGRYAGRPRSEQVPPVAFPSPPALDLRETGLVLRHKGDKQAEVRAERVEVSRDMRYAKFLGIPYATLFDKGQEVMRVRADEIVLDRQTDDLLVRGNIEITSSRGDRLRAPEGRWVASRQRLVFSKGVEMKIADSEVRADRLVVDLRMQSLELEGGVEISFQLQGASP